MNEIIIEPATRKIFIHSFKIIANLQIQRFSSDSGFAVDGGGYSDSGFEETRKIKLIAESQIKGKLAQAAIRTFKQVAGG